MVKEIQFDARGRATGVAYFDENDRLQTQPADLVVVAGAATESARLLLNSQHRLCPNGLGNRFDWVGRNLQGHTYTGAFGYFEEDLYDDLGPGAGVASAISTTAIPDCAAAPCWPTSSSGCRSSSSACCRPARRDGASAHKDAMRKYYRHTVAVQGPTQEIPLWDSRVQLDPTVRDRWGIPVLRISGDKHPHTIEIGTCDGAKGGDVAAGGRRGPDLEETAGPRDQRRPAPGRHVPHGQRPEDQRGEPELPGPRRR